MSVAALLSADDEHAALEQLHTMGCTDGLPVVIPTAERVARMVLATGYDGDLVLGAMGPNMGECSVEKLAAAAVMAGCLPDHAPVVVAATRAILDERFDLTEVQATTHAIAPLIIVNGPARDWCGGIHGGFGALGPGYRANADYRPSRAFGNDQHRWRAVGHQRYGTHGPSWQVHHVPGRGRRKQPVRPDAHPVWF